MASSFTESKARKTYLAPKYTNLLALPNKFIYMNASRNKCTLSKHELVKHIQQLVKEQPHIEDFPVSVIAVLGSDERNFRKLHTDWLIHYFEQGKQSLCNEQEAKLGNRKKFQFFEIPYTRSPGVYIWPIPYMIFSEGKNQTQICWIIHVEGNDAVLEAFAAVLSSNVILFRHSEQEAILNTTAYVAPKESLNSTSFHVYSATHLNLLNAGQPNQATNENNAGVNFLKHLHEMALTSLVDSNGQIVTVKGFIQHISNAIFRVNAFFGSLGKDSLSKDIHKTSILSNEGTIANVRSEGAYTALLKTKIVSKKTDPEVFEKPADSSDYHDLCSEKIGLTSHSKASKSTDTLLESDFAKDDAGADKEVFSCEELQCVNLSKNLRDTLDAAIQSLTPKNVHLMLQCVMPLKSRDYHGIFGELDDMTQAISLCNNEFDNMFDNYVCFAGDKHKKQILHFSEGAYRHAVTVLQEMNHIHSELTMYIFHAACITLQGHYMKQNAYIVAHEKEITHVVTSTILNSFKKKLEEGIQKNNDIQEIVKFHKVLKGHCLLMVDRCMDSKVKLNYVTKEAIDKFGDSLDDILKSVADNFGVSIWTSNKKLSNVEAALASFLKKFNKSILPRLHIYSPPMLKKHHEEQRCSVTYSLTQAEQEELHFYLNRHLICTLETQQQQLQSRVTITNDSALCIYLTSNWLKVGYFSDREIELSFKNNDKTVENIPSVLAVTNDSKVIFGIQAYNQHKLIPFSLKYYDSILTCITSAAKNFSKFGNYLALLFQNLKHTCENFKESSFQAVLVVIPSLLNADERMCLRTVLKSAGFIRIHFCNETLLMAYSAIYDSESKAEIATFFHVGTLGITVEIFSAINNNSNAKIRLLAVSHQNWLSSDTSSKLGWHLQNPFRGTSTAKNPFSSQFPYADCLRTLNIAYDKAVSALSVNISEKSTSYCMLSNQPESENIFFSWFNQRKHWIKLDNCREQHAYQMALKLSKCPNRIYEIIIDYDANIGDQDISTLLGIQSDNTLGDDKPTTERQVDDNNISPKTQKQLAMQKESLLQKCDMMRKQIAEGKVRVRALMKKVIIDAIERAEKVATDKHSSKQMVDVEDQELTELCNENHFIG